MDLDRRDPYMRITKNREQSVLRKYFLEAIESYSSVKEVMKLFGLVEEVAESFNGLVDEIINTALAMLKDHSTWKVHGQFELVKKDTRWDLKAKFSKEGYRAHVLLTGGTASFIDGNDAFLKEWSKPSVFTHEDFEAEVEREMIQYSYAHYIVYLEGQLSSRSPYLFSNPKDFACSYTLEKINYMAKQAFTKLALSYD